jgi:hypothetical protein
MRSDNQLEGDPEKPCKLRASQSARFPSWNQGIARKREFDDPIPLPDGASLSGCANAGEFIVFPATSRLGAFWTPTSWAREASLVASV